MQTTTQTGFNLQSFQAFLDARCEPDWLLELRRDAWQTFDGLDWPARNDEEWLRSDIRTFKLDRFSPSGNAELRQELPPALLSAGVDLAGRVTSVDGRLHESALSEDLQQRGVLFGGLGDVVQDSGDLLRPYLEHALIRSGYDKFAALQAAFWSGGPVLYVPRGVVVERPLHVFSLLSAEATDISRALVVLEEGAEATVLCESAGLSESAAGLHCGSIELIVKPGAHLRFVNLQDWGRGTWHFAHQKAKVGRDASLQWTVAAMGSRLAKVNQHVELVGEGADCQVNGVMFTEGKQHIAYHTLQHHVAANCHSDFLYKGALQDRSRTVWRGMIKVDPNAQQTDGYQRNDNLLLSSAVRADSIPGLEIEADDVRCTHGSTSGRVDEELIFYAQCRGFTRKEAIRAVVTGFFQQIFDRITIASVREALGQAIARRVREYE